MTTHNRPSIVQISCNYELLTIIPISLGDYWGLAVTTFFPVVSQFFWTYLDEINFLWNIYYGSSSWNSLQRQAIILCYSQKTLELLGGKRKHLIFKNRKVRVLHKSELSYLLNPLFKSKKAPIKDPPWIYWLKISIDNPPKRITGNKPHNISISKFHNERARCTRLRIVTPDKDLWSDRSVNQFRHHIPDLESNSIQRIRGNRTIIPNIPQLLNVQICSMRPRYAASTKVLWQNAFSYYKATNYPAQGILEAFKIMVFDGQIDITIFADLNGSFIHPILLFHLDQHFYRATTSLINRIYGNGLYTLQLLYYDNRLATLQDITQACLQLGEPSQPKLDESDHG